VTPGALHGVQALSREGRCKSLDASADGYGRGEAFAAALLADASSCHNGVPCAAILASTAVNQDGRSSSLTAPNGPSQQVCMRRGTVGRPKPMLGRMLSCAPMLQVLLATSLSSASLVSSDIGCVIIHGTGTSLGDPIEVGALEAALSKGSAGGTHVLASVKSCYNHTEGAAGKLPFLWERQFPAGRRLGPALSGGTPPSAGLHVLRCRHHWGFVGRLCNRATPGRADHLPAQC
jgi:acyl transferase domain-containing protein